MALDNISSAISGVSSGNSRLRGFVALIRLLSLRVSGKQIARAAAGPALAVFARTLAPLPAPAAVRDLVAPARAECWQRLGDCQQRRPLAAGNPRLYDVLGFRVAFGAGAPSASMATAELPAFPF